MVACRRRQLSSMALKQQEATSRWTSMLVVAEEAGDGPYLACRAEQNLPSAVCSLGQQLCWLLT